MDKQTLKQIEKEILDLEIRPRSPNEYKENYTMRKNGFENCKADIVNKIFAKYLS